MLDALATLSTLLAAHPVLEAALVVVATLLAAKLVDALTSAFVVRWARRTRTDLDERIHRNRSLAQLGRMSGEILDAFFARHPQPVAAPGERPPMISLPEYRERFPAAAERARKPA